MVFKVFKKNPFKTKSYPEQISRRNNSRIGLSSLAPPNSNLQGTFCRTPMAPKWQLQSMKDTNLATIVSNKSST